MKKLKFYLIVSPALLALSVSPLFTRKAYEACAMEDYNENPQQFLTPQVGYQNSDVFVTEEDYANVSVECATDAQLSDIGQRIAKQDKDETLIVLDIDDTTTMLGDQGTAEQNIQAGKFDLIKKAWSNSLKFNDDSVNQTQAKNDLEKLLKGYNAPHKELSYGPRLNPLFNGLHGFQNILFITNRQSLGTDFTQFGVPAKLNENWIGKYFALDKNGYNQHGNFTDQTPIIFGDEMNDPSRPQTLKIHKLMQELKGQKYNNITQVFVFEDAAKNYGSKKEIAQQVAKLNAWRTNHGLHPINLELFLLPNPKGSDTEFNLTPKQKSDLYSKTIQNYFISQNNPYLIPNWQEIQQNANPYYNGILPDRKINPYTEKFIKPQINSDQIKDNNVLFYTVRAQVQGVNAYNRMELAKEIQNIFDRQGGRLDKDKNPFHKMCFRLGEIALLINKKSFGCIDTLEDVIDFIGLFAQKESFIQAVQGRVDSVKKANINNKYETELTKLQNALNVFKDQKNLEQLKKVFSFDQLKASVFTLNNPSGDESWGQLLLEPLLVVVEEIISNNSMNPVVSDFGKDLQIKILENKNNVSQALKNINEQPTADTKETLSSANDKITKQSAFQNGKDLIQICGLFDALLKTLEYDGVLPYFNGSLDEQFNQYNDQNTLNQETKGWYGCIALLQNIGLLDAKRNANEIVLGEVLGVFNQLIHSFENDPGLLIAKKKQKLNAWKKIIGMKNAQFSKVNPSYDMSEDEFKQYQPLFLNAIRKQLVLDNVSYYEQLIKQEFWNFYNNPQSPTKGIVDQIIKKEITDGSLQQFIIENKLRPGASSTMGDAFKKINLSNILINLNNGQFFDTSKYSFQDQIDMISQKLNLQTKNPYYVLDKAKYIDDIPFNVLGQAIANYIQNYQYYQVDPNKPGQMRPLRKVKEEEYLNNNLDDIINKLENNDDEFKKALSKVINFTPLAELVSGQKSLQSMDFHGFFGKFFQLYKDKCKGFPEYNESASVGIMRTLQYIKWFHQQADVVEFQENNNPFHGLNFGQEIKEKQTLHDFTNRIQYFIEFTKNPGNNPFDLIKLMANKEQNAYAKQLLLQGNDFLRQQNNRERTALAVFFGISRGIGAKDQGTKLPSNPSFKDIYKALDRYAELKGGEAELVKDSGILSIALALLSDQQITTIFNSLGITDEKPFDDFNETNNIQNRIQSIISKIGETKKKNHDGTTDMSLPRKKTWKLLMNTLNGGKVTLDKSNPHSFDKSIAIILKKKVQEIQTQFKNYSDTAKNGEEFIKASGKAYQITPIKSPFRTVDNVLKNQNILDMQKTTIFPYNELQNQKPIYLSTDINQSLYNILFNYVGVQNEKSDSELNQLLIQLTPNFHGFLNTIYEILNQVITVDGQNLEKYRQFVVMPSSSGEVNASFPYASKLTGINTYKIATRKDWKFLDKEGQTRDYMPFNEKDIVNALQVLSSYPFGYPYSNELQEEKQEQDSVTHLVLKQGDTKQQGPVESDTLQQQKKTVGNMPFQSNQQQQPFQSKFLKQPQKNVGDMQFQAKQQQPTFQSKFLKKEEPSQQQQPFQSKFLKKQ